MTIDRQGGLTLGKGRRKRGVEELRGAVSPVYCSLPDPKVDFTHSNLLPDKRQYTFQLCLQTFSSARSLVVHCANYIFIIIFFLKVFDPLICPPFSSSAD